jgi:hypothetical protein
MTEETNKLVTAVTVTLLTTYLLTEIALNTIFSSSTIVEKVDVDIV